MKKFIVVISGKTCSGKTTILNKMLMNTNYSKLVTSTSRERRSGEIGGYDYHFIPSSLAEHYVDSGQFIESNVHGKHIYGLTQFELDEKLDGDRIPCVILTPNGLAPYKKIMADLGIGVLSFFIDCDEDVLFTRLAKRTQEELSSGVSDPLDTLKNSLLRVKDMMLKEKDWDSYKSEFDFVLDAEADPLHTINNKVTVYSIRKR